MDDPNILDEDFAEGLYPLRQFRTRQIEVTEQLIFLLMLLNVLVSPALAMRMGAFEYKWLAVYALITLLPLPYVFYWRRVSISIQKGQMTRKEADKAHSHLLLLVILPGFVAILFMLVCASFFVVGIVVFNPWILLISLLGLVRTVLELLFFSVTLAKLSSFAKRR